MNYQTFPDNIDLTPSKRVKFGIDPTHHRLHLGHFVPLRLIRKLHQQGHQITIVLGTFTAQLGDPSGRDTTRPILSSQEVFQNADAIQQVIYRLLPLNYRIWENHNLHHHMGVPKFIRYTAEFTVAHMMSRNAFAARSENNHPIGVHELLVPICQGLDSLELATEIEIGGEDQLFNFQIARQLQENHKFKPQDCILLPIINGTDGRKMSKSLNNCIYLDDEPNDIYGKVMSIPDPVMDQWYPLLTDLLPLSHPMESKKQLAFDIVRQIGGEGQARQAEETFQQIIQNKQVPDDVMIVHLAGHNRLLNAVVLIRECSKTEAGRLIAQGGVRINDEKQTTDCELKPGQIIKIGNRHFGKVQ